MKQENENTRLTYLTDISGVATKLSRSFHVELNIAETAFDESPN